MTLASANQGSALGKEVGRGWWKEPEDSMTQSGELGPRVPDRWEGRSEVREAAGRRWALPAAPRAVCVR